MADIRQTKNKTRDLSAPPIRFAQAVCGLWLCFAVQVAHGQTPEQANAADSPGTPNADAADVAEPTFQLNELRVLGNSVLPAATIEKTLLPFLGPGRSLKDVEAARLALETEYHGQGYGTVYVDIPEQSVGDDGVVRLRITEAKLQRSAIQGARYFSNRQIRAAIPEAERNTVPNLPRLQAQINAVNAMTGDRQIVPVIKAGATPGTVDLALKVEDRLPLHLSVELNNQYTADTTPLRASVELSYDNAFSRQDRFSATYQTSPEDTSEVQVFAAAYLARLGSSKNKLAFSYIDSASEVATVGNITVAGKGQYYNLDFIRPLASSSSGSHTFIAGLRFKDSDQGVSVAEDESLDTPLSYGSAQVGYNLTLLSTTRTWSFGASWALGLSSIGSSREEFADKCYGCKPNFSVLRVDAGLKQKLPWGLSATLQVAGQYSVDPLVSNEQVLIGGMRNVRGYLEAEELGDIGIRGAFELRTAELVPEFWGMTFAPFAFYDAGVVSFQLPLPGQDATSYLHSTGVGLDMIGWQHLFGTIVVSEPLVDGSATKRGESRVQFVVRGTL